MRDPLHFLSVKYKLSLAFAGLCLLAFGVGGLLISTSARSVLEEQIDARLEIQCRTTAQALGERLRLLARRTEDFASDGYLRERTEALVVETDPDAAARFRAELERHLLTNKLPLEPAFVGLTLVGADGLVLVHAAGPAVPIRPDVIRAALASPTLWHSDILPPGPESTRPLQAIATPLLRLGGEHAVGRLIAWVEPDDWISTTLTELEPSANARGPHHVPITLRVVDRSGHALVAGGEDVAGRARRMVFADGGAGDLADDGSPERTFQVDENGWSVRIRLKGREAFAPVSGLQSRFLGVGLVLAALCGGLLYFPMRFLVRPLRVLQDAARRIREGDYSVRVGSDATDEVGDLARSFDHMAEAVEHKTTRLRRAAEELRERQRELRTEHERLATVIRTLEDGLIVLDAEGHAILSNEAARPLLAALAAGVPALTSHAPCREEPREETCGACLLGGTERAGGCVLDLGDRIFDVRVSVLPPDAAGRRGRVLVARDVTERVARDTRDMHRERLSVLGEVAAVMAHELNNPLTSVRMFAQMLHDALPEADPLREHAAVILRNTETCRRSIAELLGYAHEAVAEPGPVRVHEVVADVCRFVRPLAERARVQVRTHLAANHELIHGDEIQIRQVFVNLVLNAIQAAGPDGSMVTIESRSAGRSVEVDVIDTGSGMTAEARQRAFDAFFSTKPRGEGTGLGLPTARRIAELHGGGLDIVESGPGRTVLRVRLRLEPAAVADAVSP